MEKLWTITEVARFLGIQEEGVEQLVREGLLIGYKLGGQFLRFRPSQVEAVKGTFHTPSQVDRRPFDSPASGGVAQDVARTEAKGRPERAERVEGRRQWSPGLARGAPRGRQSGLVWAERLREFVYFYDFYLVSATLLAAMVVYLMVW